MARGPDDWHGDDSSRWWQRPVARFLLPGAAAAVVILAFAVRRVPPSPPVPNASSTEIVAFIPVGEIRRVTEFRWASPVEASRYIIVARNGGTAEILRRETADQRLDIGLELTERFPPGLYNWTVEALDRDGRTIATSRIQTFEIR